MTRPFPGLMDGKDAPSDAFSTNFPPMSMRVATRGVGKAADAESLDGRRLGALSEQTTARAGAETCSERTDTAEAPDRHTA